MRGDFGVRLRRRAKPIPDWQISIGDDNMAIGRHAEYLAVRRGQTPRVRDPFGRSPWHNPQDFRPCKGDTQFVALKQLPTDDMLTDEGFRRRYLIGAIPIGQSTDCGKPIGRTNPRSLFLVQMTAWTLPLIVAFGKYVTAGTPRKGLHRIPARPRHKLPGHRTRRAAEQPELQFDRSITMAPRPLPPLFRGPYESA